jgi:hypothetical protein
MTATYEKIATTTLGTAAATVTFSSISGSYTDIVLIIAGTNSASTDDVALQFNGDTSTNYSRTFVEGTGSAVASGRNTSLNAAALGGYVASSANFNSIINIMNYSNTTTFKTQVSRGNDPTGNLYMTVGLWRNTAAITSILVKWYSSAGQYGVGTTFTLYGILKAA